MNIAIHDALTNSMKTLFRCIALLALSITPLARADDSSELCSHSTLAAVARWANVTGKLALPTTDVPDGLIVTAACKAMPDTPDVTIAAMAFDTKHQSLGEEGRKLQVIALVQDGKVIATNRSIVEEDAATAFDSNSFHIDTARYQLAPGVRAFGVIFNSAAPGPSCADADAGEELTLYLRQGSRLRPIFGTNLDGWVSIKGENCGLTNKESTLDESANMTISVEKASTHGFADLAITAHAVRTACPEDGGNCSDTPRQVVREVIKYNGETYGINMSRTFWYPADSRMSDREIR